MAAWATCRTGFDEHTDGRREGSGARAQAETPTSPWQGGDSFDGVFTVLRSIARLADPCGTGAAAPRVPSVQ
jgi:hypothetical protein